MHTTIYKINNKDLLYSTGNYTQYLTIDYNGRGQSQDGGLGGHRIRVSTQLGHLPGTGGGPQTPKGTGGTPSDWLAGSCFPGQRSGLSSCGGSSESKPLD